MFVISGFRREVDNCALLAQRVVVICYQRFGSTYRSNLSKVKKKEPIGSPEKSVMVLRISNAFDAIDFGVFLLTVEYDSNRNLVFSLIGEILFTNFVFMCQT